MSQRLGRWTGIGARCAAAYAAWVVLTNVLHGYLRAQALGSAADGGEVTSYSMGPLEHAVFGGSPSLWLQRTLPFQQPLDVVTFAIWASLFYMPVMLLMYVLAVRGTREFVMLLALHTIVVLMADAVYAFFPTRPPWMDEPVRRTIAEMSAGLPSLDANPYASAPSLHVGVPAAYALWFAFHHAPRLRRIGHVLIAWVLLMWFSVVYAGEHYVLGALAGLIWAALLYGVMRTLRATYASGTIRALPVRDGHGTRAAAAVIGRPVAVQEGLDEAAAA